MVLNVRGVPNALITRLKMRGLICNSSLKDCVIAALVDWVDRNDKLDQKLDEQRFRAAMGDNRDQIAAIAEETKIKYIPVDET